ncbi:hypothetical protein ACFQPA_16445 [Halomarina halobia]|uniref:HEAT repeat domain-containing protein n=1 Tax=Halomarina halobia TaxID=3033386 RepID=A0ABD6AE20_9EURY|nr:hypothetical protein [Halomarina sp. PSR21]
MSPTPDPTEDPAPRTTPGADRPVNDVTCDGPDGIDLATAVDPLDSDDDATRAASAEALARAGAQRPDRLRPFAAHLANHVSDNDLEVRAFVLSALAAIANVAPRGGRTGGR